MQAINAVPKWPSHLAPRFLLTTAVDDNVRLRAELVLWVICARKHLPDSEFRLAACLIDFEDAPFEQWLASNNVDVIHAGMPVPGVPHCNRIAALLGATREDYVVVTDSDLYVLQNFSMLLRQDDSLQAAPNNAGNPPPHIFKTLLSASGIRRPYRPTFTLQPSMGGKQETHINNISAGIVVVPSKKALVFAETWMKWARWLAQRRELLQAWVGHIDQVAFALACEDTQTDVIFLPPQLNLVLELLDRIETIFALHLTTAHVGLYPARFGSEHTLLQEGLSQDVADAIGRLNACILEARQVMTEIPSLHPARDTLLVAR